MSPEESSFATIIGWQGRNGFFEVLLLWRYPAKSAYAADFKARV
jgi:hypothetical protein